MLVTPEAVRLEVRPAGPGTRIAARAVDALVQGAIAVGGFIAVAAAGSATGAGTALIIVYLVLVFAAIFVYPAVTEALWRGRTLGKAAFGLRVVTAQGSPVTFRHTAIRSALWIVDGMLVAGPVVGVLCLLLTRDTVRVGDMVAGTIVVRERSGAGAVTGPMVFVPPQGLDGYAATLDVATLGDDGYGLVRSFLARADTLDPAARLRVALTVAEAVAGRMRIGPQPVHPEAFLRSVAAAVQRGAPIAPPPPPVWRFDPPAPTAPPPASEGWAPPV